MVIQKQAIAKVIKRVDSSPAHGRRDTTIPLIACVPYDLDEARAYW